MSETYDLIKASASGRRAGFWCERIKTEAFDVPAVDSSVEDLDDLSDADERRLNEISDEFGHMDQDELVE